MRKLISICALFCTLAVSAQRPDSVLIKQLDSLSSVSIDWAGKRDFEKAQEVNAAARTMALEKTGRESAAYGNACFDLGAIFLQKGDYPQAEKWFLESEDIYAKTLGKEHRLYVLAIDNLSDVYLRMRDFDKSEHYHIQVRDIREKVLGKNHKDYVSSLSNLANLYTEMGDYEKAEPIYIEAIALREKVSGKESRDYATGLNNMGLNYLKAGNYDKAEPLLLEAFHIRERVVGKKHPHYASSLNNLGQLYADKGDFESAEPFLVQAMEARLDIFGANHPAYSWSLNNLGQFYMDIGAYEKAEGLFTKALGLKEKTLGKMHPDYAKSLNNLAKLYIRAGNFEKAEPLLLEAQRINEEKLGTRHPDYLSGLNYLATLYQGMGNTGKAEVIRLQEKSIWEASAHTGHPQYALCLQGLATIYENTGRLQDAGRLYLASKQILNGILGPVHPAQVEVTRHLANMHWMAKDYQSAAQYLAEANEIQRELITRASRHLSERELSSYTRMFAETQNGLFSLASAKPGLSAVCYDNILFHKGFLLNTVSQINRKAVLDPIALEQIGMLKSFHRRLAAEYAKPLLERKNVVELEEKANAAEKELARNVAGFAEAVQQVAWQDVQRALQPGEAAIEFVHFRVVNPQPTDSILYAALVLLPGAGEPVFLPLFEEKQLGNLLQSQGKPKADFIHALYSAYSGKASLYDLIWAPLESVLGGVSTVYFSASGLLHRLNLSAIAAPVQLRGETGAVYLADHYQLVQLGSTRQLVTRIRQTTSSGQDARLFGGIEYEADTSIVEALADVQVSRRSESYFPADSTLRGEAWNYLKWTEVEIGAIELILSEAGMHVALRQGRHATEEAFKSMGAGAPSPRVLHVATHGFFFPDVVSGTQRAVAPPGADRGAGQPVFKISDQPMIRSGLIFAGGNYAWEHGRPVRPEMEDGILTAYEISQMNFGNTELAVLSACETGLGEVQGNEGVYGLQRAFKIAGVKYLVMSLWQVPDFQTQELMTAFYSGWLDKNMTLPDAFRAAQQEMRHKYKSPFYWAGFILVE